MTNCHDSTGIYEAMVKNASVTVPLVSKGLSGSITAPAAVEDSIRCLQVFLPAHKTQSLLGEAD